MTRYSKYTDISLLGIKCPYCDTPHSSRVLDTLRNTNSLKRTRECIKCGKKFTTVEKVVN